MVNLMPTTDVGKHPNMKRILLGLIFLILAYAGVGMTLYRHFMIALGAPAHAAFLSYVFFLLGSVWIASFAWLSVCMMPKNSAWRLVAVGLSSFAFLAALFYAYLFFSMLFSRSFG